MTRTKNPSAPAPIHRSPREGSSDSPSSGSPPGASSGSPSGSSSGSPSGSRSGWGALPSAPVRQVAGTGFRLTEFTVYRWNNPETDSEYPYLAAPADRSSLLSFGNSAIYFDIEFPRDGNRWLDRDYVPITERIYFDMISWVHAVETPFPGGIYFGMLRINRSGRPVRLELSTKAQRYADDGPEYELPASGPYRRWHNATRAYSELSTDEQQMLDRGLQVIAPLIAQVESYIHADPPPRFCSNPGIDPETAAGSGRDAFIEELFGDFDSGAMRISLPSSKELKSS